MSSFRTSQDVQRQHAEAEFQRQVRVGLDQIYLKFPTIKPCIASGEAIVEMCNRFMGAEVVPTVALFEMAVAENPDIFRQTFPVASLPAQKEDIIDEICDLLRSPTGDGRGGRYSNAALANERRRISSWTREQLAARRDQIIEAQRLAKFSPGELREQIAQHRAAQQPGRLVLPAEYTVERLKSRGFPVQQLKKLIRQYGADVVNDRLFGRS